MTIISYSQYYYGATTIPKNATENDSIIVVDTFQLTMSNDYKSSTTVTKTADTITIHNCYTFGGGLAISFTQIEYTNIGKLNAGKYIIKIEGEIRMPNSCTSIPNFLNTFILPIEVSPITSVANEYTNFNSTVTSNTFSDIIRIDNTTDIGVIKIFDLDGRLCFQQFENDKSIVIETSEWRKGFYILSIECGHKLRRFKLLKV